MKQALYKNGTIRNSILVSLLMSYLCAFLLPFAAMLYHSTMLKHSIDEQRIDQQLASIQQIRSFADQNFSQIHSQSSLLLSDPRVKSLIYTEDPSSPSTLLECMKVKNLITTQVSVNSIIKDICLYYPSTGLVLSAEGLFYKDMMSDAAFPLRELWPELQPKTSFSGNRRTFAYSSGDGNDGFLFCHKLYSAPDRSTNVIAIVLINRSLFLRQVQSFLPSKDTRFFMEDMREGLTIFSAASAIDPLWLASPEGVKHSAPQRYGDSLVTMRTSQVDSNIRFCIVDPVSDEVAPSMIFSYTSIVLCLLLGIGIMIYAVKHQYSPIQHIYNDLHTFYDKKGGGQSPSLNTSIHNLLEEIDVRKQQTDEHIAMLRDYTLQRMLNGKYMSQEAFRDVCEKHQLNLKPGRFCVCVITLDDYKSLESGTGQQISDSIRLLLRTVDAFVKDAFMALYQLETVIVDDRLLMLLNSDGELTTDAIAQKMDYVKTALQDDLSISISVGIGDVIENCLSIKSSYTHAARAVEYMLVTSSSNHCICIDNICDEENTSNLENDAHLQHIFYNNMATQNYKAAYDALCMFMDPESISTDVGLRLWQSKRVLLEYMLLASLANANLLHDFDAQLSALKKATSAKKFMDGVERLFHQLEEKNESQKQTREKLQDKIKNYVDKNYTSPDISINAIADLCDVSVSYVSRSFKNATNIGLLDYIHMLRIAKAKALLENTNKSIKDIAAETGYLSSLTLSRAFSRYEGITPSEYRSLHGQ